ncbi:hypothetical protein D043_4093A, partial [Vibrio parahaemolyticus EKP-021]
MASHKSA